MKKFLPCAKDAEHLYANTMFLREQGSYSDINRRSIWRCGQCNKFYSDRTGVKNRGFIGCNRCGMANK